MDFNKKNIETYKTREAIKHYTTNEIKPIEKKLIDKYFKSPVLDLGCGVGRTTKYLFEKGFKVIGIDIIEEMIKTAKSLYPKINFQTGDACNLKFKDNSFNTVFFSFNGLDYIFPKEKRVRALKEIERLLKKEGIFVFSSHNPLALFLKFRPKFIFRNLKRGSLFSRYKIETHLFGELSTYYSSPRRQIKIVEKNTNLRFIALYRKDKADLHPHYVFKKIIKDNIGYL